MKTIITMKTNIKVLLVSSLAVLVLAGCEKKNKTQTEPPMTNTAPGAVKPDASVPAAPSTGAGETAPAVPANTNNPAVINQ